MKSHRPVGFLIGILLVATPAFGAIPTVGAVQYGSRCDREACVEEFLVQVGEPRMAPERFALEPLVGRFLAQGTLWVRANDGDGWIAIDHRLPTREDFQLANSLGELMERLEIRDSRSAADLPAALRSLASEMLINIEAFIAFHEGDAFRIYLRDDSERAAQRLTEDLKQWVSKDGSGAQFVGSY